ncbi:FMN-dependent NADH-azoreductase [Kroppenstedtia eburnea]|uniref:FMN dependent NADH:quinone oxidoreductase n=1 Tax=Kroppenstedtia eburnea TaxID=714067 RepID=A0A1N7ISZ2_9BACL|nr:FMN-dependent NADH-azoreductase [Kroppenstedtia eburnea]EGK13776.1 FMN-dependent NADH-azoreductase 4 [Desmospora sp. 8437]QKI82170.1 FMN-dependent NADH-azoreductase [Kroppenstedtia eburnea]SIS40203.1 FMN-dependent NADH-azoreductase [Kroppenstedtia eburnea]
MTTTLFVKANNRPTDQSVTVRLYEAFLQSYQESHPEDQVVELDLYGVPLPYMDAGMINGIFKSRQGMELTPQEKEVIDIVDQHLEQFLAADKVVMAFPLWNLTVPAVLHTYIDYLNRAGKTFRYTPEGSVGLVPDKKVALLNARGGIYSEGEAASSEMAVNFVLKNLQLFGITDITTVIVEGHNQFPDQREKLIEDGIQQAVQAARRF